MYRLLYSWFSHGLAGVSLFSLVHGAVGAVEMSGPVRAVVAGVKVFLDFFFGDLADALAYWLSIGMVWFLGLAPVLEKHWQNIFALLTLYFFRDADQFFRIGHTYAGWVSLLAGFLIALCAGVGAGLLPPEQTQFLTYAAMVAIPVVAYVVYAFTATLANAVWHRQSSAAYLQVPLEPFFQYLGRRTIWAFQRGAAGFLLALPVYFILRSYRVESPALFMIAVLVLVMALYWLYRGSIQAMRQAHSTGLPLPRAFLASGNFTMGLDMLTKCLTGAGIWGADAALVNFGF